MKPCHETHQKREAIKLERLKELIEYNEFTGEFVWRVNRSWCAKIGVPAGWRSPTGYLSIGIDGVSYMAHRLAWLYVHGTWPVNDIDHINGDPSDNRMINLRDATKHINHQNIKTALRNSKIGVLGVVKPKHGRFRANIRINGRQINIGRYDTVDQAHEAYLLAKRKFHEGCTI